MRLLTADEPFAVTVELPQGASPFVLTCDHASARIPAALGTLGLTAAELRSHIAWDIGAAAVAERLAARLDATLLKQNYSRLVIDCNRPPGSDGSIPLSSDSVAIDANGNLDAAATAARVAEIFAPYHAALRAILERRRHEGRPTVLIAVHSFTPIYQELFRPWHIGVMYRHDKRMGAALLKSLRQHEDIRVGDNQPYAIEDGIDYTIPQHGEAAGIAHAGLEIRQDLITDDAGWTAWADRLAGVLTQSVGPLLEGSSFEGAS